MNLGCNTYSLKACRRADAFDHIRRIGFTAIELWVGHASYLDASVRPPEVAGEARAAGLHLGAYCIGGLFGLPLTAVRERVARAFEFGHGLGVDLVTGIIDRRAVPLVDRLCAKHAMRFAIENHWYAEFARPRDYTRTLADASPAVGVNIDTGHFAFLGCDLQAVGERLGARTLNVHLKAVRTPGRLARLAHRLRKEHRMPPALPGAGDGFTPFVAALRAAGYGGMLAVEHEADGVRLDDLRRYRERGAALVAAAAAPEAVAVRCARG